MEKAKQITDRELLKQRGELTREGVDFSLSQSLSERGAQEWKYSPLYPSPRRLEQQRLVLPTEAGALIPLYREQILSNYERMEKDGSISKEKAAELRKRVIIAQEGQEEELLSTLCDGYSGVTMEKLLRFIPEELHRLNKGLRTLSDGRAYGSENLQLSLFPEVEQRALEESRRRGAPVLRYNAREWAKIICGTTNPKKKQIEYVERAVEALSRFRIYYPLPDGRFYYNTLLQRRDEGIVGGKGGGYEYIQVAPFFALALTQGKRGALYSDTEVVWKLSLPRVNEQQLSTKIDFKLLSYLEYLYSFARTDIQAKAQRGEVEYHRETIENLLQRVAGEGYLKVYSSRSSNKSKALKDIRSAFEKMERLGIVKEGTLKEEKGSIIWGWGNL